MGGRDALKFTWPHTTLRTQNRIIIIRGQKCYYHLSLGSCSHGACLKIDRSVRVLSGVYC